ncbi:unnamed protein product [Gongylonema pulchrum]|uniref:Protein S-acyltransferase n=1 Tax=Gongylonema pulchrum TaxID=637853 RepID=A0A3P6S8G7_9BILA|nr:unnamed protein product [Gongylonema pulchrum]
MLAPWHDWLCEMMPNFLNSTVCFVYGLAALLFIILGLFAAWNMYLISIGETFVDYLQHADDRRNATKWRSPNHLGFTTNWRCFLGLYEGRTFMRHILLPSSHGSIDKCQFSRNSAGLLRV